MKNKYNLLTHKHKANNNNIQNNMKEYENQLNSQKSIISKQAEKIQQLNNVINNIKMEYSNLQNQAKELQLQNNQQKNEIKQYMDLIHKSEYIINTYKKSHQNKENKLPTNVNINC